MYVCHLQRYLTEFRVVELKELLRVMGLSQKGRKPELFKRANDLLIHGSPKVQQQIREIFNRSHRSRRSLKYGKMGLYTDMKDLIHHHTPKSELGSTGAVMARGGSGGRGGTGDKSYILHPDVRFKPHPFYTVMDSVIRPTALGEEVTNMVS